MKKIWLLFFTLLSLSFSLEVPKLQGYVNDYAKLLKPEEKQAISGYLENYNQEKKNQIIVLTIPSLKGEDISQYSMKVAEKWKIGEKDIDNGVILLIAKKERKLRIEVGYGLEGVLTDGESGEIIRYAIKPYFKEGLYGKGMINGLYAITKALSGDFQPTSRETSYAQQAVDQRINAIFILSIFVGFLAWIFFKGGNKLAPAILGILTFPILLLILGWKLTILFLAFSLLLGPVYGYIIMLLFIVFMESRFFYFLGGGFGGSSGFGGGGGSFGGGGASGSW